VTVDGFGPVPRGAPLAVIAPPCWPPKDPGDVLDYVVDFSEAVEGDSGDAIATLDVQMAPALPGDLSLQSCAADGTQAILWLSAGFAGTSYEVTVVAGMNSGRVLSRTIVLPVLSLATPPVSPDALTDQSGMAITDQTGQAITS
jgi:hypothetical protein